MARMPKPASHHRAIGGYRADRHKEFNLRPSKPPRPPAGLSVGAAAKWREVAKLLATAGILTKLDLDLLRVYSETWVSWVKATETVAAEGQTYKSESGQQKPHPCTLIAAQARKDLAALADRLALSVTSRQRMRIELPDEPSDSPARKFLPEFQLS